MTHTNCRYCSWDSTQKPDNRGPIVALYWHYRLTHEPYSVRLIEPASSPVPSSAAAALPLPAAGSSGGAR